MTSPTMVHLRLGDYKTLSHIYGVVDINLIAKLVRDEQDRASRPIWIFTDSPEDLTPKATNALNASRVIGPSDLSRPIENMVLMSLGGNIVCSNSTFSWWSAFLKGERGKVFFPKNAGLSHQIFSPSMVNDRWSTY
jgi:hypothetical protein